jgi:hypothetical protein
MQHNTRYIGSVKNLAVNREIWLGTPGPTHWRRRSQRRGHPRRRPLQARLRRSLIAFVPSLDLVITRQTGSSGSWPYEEYLRRACQAVLPDSEWR